MPEHTLHALHPHPSLRWRLYDDGVVVHVGETCETHCLPPPLAVLLEGPSRVMAEEGLDALEQEADGSFRMPARALGELVRLHILVAT